MSVSLLLRKKKIENAVEANSLFSPHNFISIRKLHKINSRRRNRVRLCVYVLAGLTGKITQWTLYKIICYWTSARKFKASFELGFIQIYLTQINLYSSQWNIIIKNVGLCLKSCVNVFFKYSSF